MDTDNEYRDCPLCGNQVKAKAMKCKHCKLFIDAEPEETIPDGDLGDKPGEKRPPWKWQPAQNAGKSF